ncbi:MAG: chemotaxis protein CheW [Oscillospiraceae bacterium]|jgi:chemotaxis signal transduction protein|nr:chemotaxis protein CheW [Oscillospiraceae bacterium]
MLTNERKLEIYTERLWRLAIDLALQSSLGGKERYGIAVVAEETRNISKKLYHLLETKDSDALRASIGDALVQLQALMLNGWLEMLRAFKVHESDNPYTGPTTVLLEEIKDTANEIRRLFGLPDMGADLLQPELKHKSTITNRKLFLMQMSIGGVPFVENAVYVQEIATYIEGDMHFGIRDGHLYIRGMAIPVIDCYKRFGLERPGAIDRNGRKCAVIIETVWENQSAKYAVLVDSLPLSFGFYTSFSEGQNVDSRSEIFTNQYVRASWDTVDDRQQMLFLDWKALA